MPDDIMAETEQAVTNPQPPATSLSFDYSNGDESSSSQQQQQQQQNQAKNESIVAYTPGAPELNPLSQSIATTSAPAGLSGSISSAAVGMTFPHYGFPTAAGYPGPGYEKV